MEFGEKRRPLKIDESASKKEKNLFERLRTGGKKIAEVLLLTGSLVASESEAQAQIQIDPIENGLQQGNDRKKLDPNQEGAIQLENTEVKNVRDMMDIHEQLVSINQPIYSLSGKEFNSERLENNIAIFRKDLWKIEQSVTRFLEKKKSTHDQKLIAKGILNSINNLREDLENFNSVNPFQVLSGDYLHSLYVDEHDAKSQYMRFGIDTDTAILFAQNSVSEELVKRYDSKGLLDKSFYPFILKGIPVEVVQEYIKHFSVSDAMKTSDSFNNNQAVDALLKIGPKHNTAELNVGFVAEYIKRNFVDYGGVSTKLLETNYKEVLSQREYTDYSISQIDVLFQIIPGESEEKIKIIQQYTDMGFSLSEIIFCNSNPDLSLRRITEQVKESNNLLTPRDVYGIHIYGIDSQRLQSLYAALPKNISRIYFDYLTVTKILPNVPIENMVPYMQLLSSETDEALWVSTVSYFMNNTISIDTVRQYLEAGAEDCTGVKKIMEAGVKLQFLQELRGKNIKIRSDQVIEFYAANIAIEEIQFFYTLYLSGNKNDSILSVENIYKYRSVIKSPEQELTFLKLLQVGYPASAALDLVEKNISKNEVSDILQYRIGPNLIIELKQYNAFSIVSFLESQRVQDDKMNLYINDVVFLLSNNVQLEDIKKMIQLKFDLRFANEVHKHGENWQEYIPYKDFINAHNFEQVRLAHFFEISPATLKFFSKKTHAGNGYTFSEDDINKIIKKASQENILTPKMQQFLSRYKISFPSRYPFSILEHMKNGYESKERESKPTAVVLVGKNDAKGAFQHNNIYEGLLPGYNVYLYEVSSEQDFNTAIEQLGATLAETGKKIDLMLIGGHGKSDLINFSQLPIESASLDIEDINSMNDPSIYFAKDAKVILQSCSTGAGGNGAQNIASAISKKFGGLEVHAPNKDTGDISIVYDESGNVRGVTYGKEGENIGEVIQILP